MILTLPYHSPPHRPLFTTRPANHLSTMTHHQPLTTQAPNKPHYLTATPTNRTPAIKQVNRRWFLMCHNQPAFKSCTAVQYGIQNLHKPFVGLQEPLGDFIDTVEAYASCLTTSWFFNSF